jgi:YegS/Rv2252/BmrU family lipid kinase
MTELVTIVNPSAGGGRCGRRVDGALARLRAAGLELDVRRTTRPGEATDIARAAYGEGARRFLAVGGDGTSFEIVNGLFPRPHGDDEPVTLGILPLGTGNSFLRDFQITDAESALCALERGDTRPVDVVRAEHDGGTIHYINLLSIGFTAEAGGLTNDKFKPLGAAGYVLAVLVCTARLSHPVFPMRIDGGAVDDRPCVLLSFSNSRFTGGTMMMAPHADPCDGTVDVIRIGPIGKVKLIRAFPRIFKGSHVEIPEVEEALAHEVELESVGETEVMVDGEVLRLSLKRLEVLPGALEVIA